MKKISHGCTLDCADCCKFNVYVKNDDIIKIEGDKEHPYTKGLLSCIANPEDTERKELHPIPGSPPDLLNISDGCPFVDRCEDAMNICPLKMDEYREYSKTHICSCWLGNPIVLKKGE